MTKHEIVLACQEHLFPCVFHYYREPLEVARAKGPYVWDADDAPVSGFLRRHRYHQRGSRQRDGHSRGAPRHTYHGRSALGMTLTGQSTWRLGGVTEAGIVRAHNAYCYRCPFGVTYPACEVAYNPHGAQQ